MGLFDDVLPIVGAGAGFFLGGPAGAAMGYSMGAGISNSNRQAQTNKDMMNQNLEFYNRTQADQNTAHQREVADLKAAGLNPILSANKGAGVASGSSPSLTAPQIQTDAVYQALSLHETMKNNSANRSLLSAEKELKEAQTQQVKQQTELDANSLTGAASHFFKGLINKDKSEPSFNSIKDKVKNYKPKSREDWETQRQQLWKQKSLQWPKGK